MNRLLYLFIFLLLSNIGNSQILDTLYYDEQWQGVENKDFAHYIRYVYYAAPNSSFKNRFKTYYRTGELYAEGEFVKIDRYNDKNSILEKWKSYYKNGKLLENFDVINGSGINTKYYKNGNIQQIITLKDYKIHGELTTYWENGLIKTFGFHIDNNYDGIYYEFSEDGNSCAQYEYINGEISKPYFTYVTKEGTITKYKIEDNTPYLEMPSINEKQTFHDKGTTWDYYIKNGLTLMVNGTLNRDYGKYITLQIVLSNNSNIPITFNPALITAYKEHKGKIDNLKILTASEYISKVSNRQNWSMFFNALNESMAAAKAGYSSSSTQTTSVYGGASVSSGVGAAFTNTGEVAVGVGVSATSCAGYSTTSSSTVNYNGAAAYQAQLIASGRIADYNSIMLNERNMKEEGYLKITTINPQESISGYINIPYSKGELLVVNIVIDSMVYPFSWNMSN